MKITIKLFAILRDRAGVSDLTLDLRNGAHVTDAAAAVAEQLPQLGDFLPRVAYAINREYTTPTAELHEGDELALIPPVSGG